MDKVHGSDPQTHHGGVDRQTDIPLVGWTDRLMVGWIDIFEVGRTDRLIMVGWIDIFQVGWTDRQTHHGRVHR